MESEEISGPQFSFTVNLLSNLWKAISYHLTYSKLVKGGGIMFKSKKLIVAFTAIFMQIALVICSPSIANDDATARAILEDIQRQIQKYKASSMSVGNRAMYVAELEIEKSTILAGFDKSKAIDNLENTEWYIKSLRISSGNERKLLAFVRKAKIVLLRGGIPNATFPGFGY